MSDTVLIEEEKDIEHIATRKVAVIRKKMMAVITPTTPALNNK